MSAVLLRPRGAVQDYRCDCGSVLFRKDNDLHYTCMSCSAGFTATPLDPAVDAAGPRAGAWRPAPSAAPAPVMVSVPYDVLEYVLDEAESVDHRPHEERVKMFSVVYAALKEADSKRGRS